MRKMLFFLFVLLWNMGCVLLTNSYAQDEEQLTLITYYPAPYGVYEVLNFSGPLYRIGSTCYGTTLRPSHINLGVTSITGENGQNWGYSTVSGGINNTASTYCATVSGGRDNTASSSNATVSGGNTNTASGDYATVSGGHTNTAMSIYTTVAGGTNNTADGQDNTVSGGDHNTAGPYFWATVSGGDHNTANGQYATVAGGGSNTAEGTGATVSGGSNNTTNVRWTTISGGNNNSAGGWYATIAGGQNNTANGRYSFAAGRRAKALRNGSFVWADSTDADYSSTNQNEFRIRASGGFFLKGNPNIRQITAGERYAYLDVIENTGEIVREGWNTYGSSRKFKEDITDIEIDTGKIYKLKPVSFTWKDSRVRDFGLIAEDVNEILPELVIYDDKGEPEAIKDEKIIFFILAEVKNLKKTIEQQNKLISNLEKRIAELE